MQAQFVKKFVIVCVLAGAVLAGFQIMRHFMPRQTQYAPRPLPELSTEDLAATTVVPTLESTVPESGNVIWCATFQVAWENARQQVGGSPLLVENAETLTTLLNQSPVSASDLPDGRYYARAGFVRDGLADAIRTEMASQFPEATPPDFSALDPSALVAYCYLNAACKFATPLDDSHPLEFQDAAGNTHHVASFGISDGGDYQVSEKQAEQFAVLFYDDTSSSDGESTSRSFALDLTGNHPEHQVIVAIIPRAPTLQAMLDDLATRSTDYRPEWEQQRRLDASEHLQVPNVSFNLRHHYRELLGNTVLTPELEGQFIVIAQQSILFRLDKSGATTVSEAIFATATAPSMREFSFDRPFLIILKQRAATHPYFVAWVENIELLEP